MRFLISHSALLAAITKVGAVTVKSSSNPVLGAILIESTPAGITLIGTDKALTMILASTSGAFLLSRTGYRMPLIVGVLFGSLATFLLSIGIHEPTILGFHVSNLVTLSFIMGI